MISDLRIRAVNDAPVAPAGRYVLYWMIAARRARWNAALERAVAQARALAVPLVVLEALRVDHPWASARFHQFVLDGMRDNAAAFDRPGVRYLSYVEPQPGAGRGLLEALAADACVVVTDDFPAFFLPRMVARAGARLRVRLEAVDGNGLLPLAAADRAFATAYAFRRFLQHNLAAHLAAMPDAEPLAVPLPKANPILPRGVVERWPEVARPVHEVALAALPIDRAVVPTAMRGGAAAGRERLDAFVAHDLDRYADHRNDPAVDGSSRLSAYLHFGHVGAHEVFAAVMTREGWLGAVPRGGNGARQGWWGVSRAAEAFLDQLVTWRELGCNMCARRPDDYQDYASLPAWALATLDAHAGDPRDVVYTPAELDAAATHDPLWNAAQRQLHREGRIHNYLRMLWGKKILEWSPTPREALAAMIALNDRYALDGRDPNSYSGIFWILGRYDRPWGPERDVFGTVRYMSSENTARKLRVGGYLKRYADQPTLFDPA